VVVQDEHCPLIRRQPSEAAVYAVALDHRGFDAR
jgi:hypothetical protein